MAVLKNLHVLFADDEKYYARPTLEALEKEVGKIKYVTDGVKVLEYLEESRNSPPDIILLDIMMPEGGSQIVTNDKGRSTGVVLYNKIRNELKLDVPILVITAIDVDEQLISANFSNDHRVAILNKPYLFSEVISKINYLMKRVGKR